LHGAFGPDCGRREPSLLLARRHQHRVDQRRVCQTTCLTALISKPHLKSQALPRHIELGSVIGLKLARHELRHIRTIACSRLRGSLAACASAAEGPSIVDRLPPYQSTGHSAGRQPLLTASPSAARSSSGTAWQRRPSTSCRPSPRAPCAPWS